MTIYLYSFRYFTSVSKLKAIGQLLMEILYFEDLGIQSVVYECSLGVVNLVIDNFFVWFCIQLQILHLCMKFESNRTITYGDIAFWRFGGYRVSFGCECSCASPRRVSNFNSNVPQDVREDLPSHKIWVRALTLNRGLRADAAAAMLQPY